LLSDPALGALCPYVRTAPKVDPAAITASIT
jgi:hypothetical protein